MPADDPTLAQLFVDAVLRTVGRDGLTKLRAIAGGREVTVPIYPVEASVIVRALGMADAQKVCAEMRSNDASNRPVAYPPFYLPIGRADGTAVTRGLIAQLHAMGRTGAVIALELGIAERTVRKHLAMLRAEGKLPAPRPQDHSANIGEMVPPATDEASQ